MLLIIPFLTKNNSVYAMNSWGKYIRTKIEVMTMKKGAIAIFLLASLMLPGKNTFASVVVKDLTPEARSVLVMDSKTKMVLYEKRGYEMLPMASTTKILTAHIATHIEDKNEKLEVSKNAASIRGSKVGYRPGEKLTIEELTYGLMLRSGNDAAITLAEGIGGSIEGFSALMNDFSTSLGLVNSHFKTPHGLDTPGHYTTSYDLALLTSNALECNDFKAVCSVKNISKTEKNFSRDYANINKILWKIPEANGVKTGYTGQAGKCLVTSVNHQGRDIVIVVLNCVERWKVTERMYKYVVDNYDFKEVDLSQYISKEDEYGQKILKGRTLSVPVKKNSDITASVQLYRKSKDIKGKVRVYSNNEEIYSCYIR